MLVTRPARLVVAVAFAAALAVSTSAGRAYACDCAVSTPEDNLARAELAFVGIVKTVAIPPSVAGRDTSLDPIAVTFAVETILKWTPGGPASEITISTPSNSAACGVAFVPGERWRIYATVVNGGNPRTDLCSGDEPLGHAAIPAETPAGPPVPLLIAAGLAVVLVAASARAVGRWARRASA